MTINECNFTVFRVFGDGEASHKNHHQGQNNHQGNLAAVTLSDQLPSLDQHLTYPHPAETCVYLKSISESHYKIRWFNTKQVIQRCGHGSLAAAALLNTLYQHKQYRFDSDSETLSIRCCSAQKFALDLPIETLSWTDPCSYKALHSLQLAQTQSPYGYLIAELTSVNAVQEFVLSDSLVSLIQDRALIITAQDKRAVNRIVFRYFAPQYGIQEDMATGSAASVLWPYWHRRFKSNFSFLNCYQASPAGGYFQLKANNADRGGKKTVSVVGNVKKIEVYSDTSR